MSKFIILDRDGTIIEDRGYLHKNEDLKFLPGAIDGLKEFRDAGYRFIVVTNQAGIARGIFTPDQLDTFHNELIRQLRADGINIAKIYYCPHHPKFTAPCSCRKPGTEMVQRAAKEFKFDPADCIYIGDKDLDIELGKNCMGITVLIENNQYPNLIQPDFKAKDLKHAFELLKTAGTLAC